MATNPNNGGKTRAFKRRTTFIVAGWILANICFVLFAFTFGHAIYKAQGGWKTLPFKGTTEVGDKCRISALATDSIESPANLRSSASQAITLPHAKDLIIKKFPTQRDGGRYLHAYYRCTVNLTSTIEDKGLVYLHIGHIRAEWSRVYIDGQLRTSFAGTDKVSLPIPLGDDKPDAMILEIQAYTKAKADFGVRGLNPVVIAEGLAKNAQIFGINTFFNTVWPLFNLLPALVLGLILWIGWISGLHYRVMVPAFMFIMFTGIKQLSYIMAEELPWSQDVTYTLFEPLFAGITMSFLLFAMEVIGIHGRKIPKLMVGLVIGVFAGVVVVIMSDQPSALVGTFQKVNRTLLFVGSIYLIGKGLLTTVNQSSDHYLQKGRRRANLWVLAVNFVLVGSIFIDILMEEIILSSFRIGNMVELFFPMFIGGILLYYLYLIDAQLKAEQHEKAKYETELAMAAKLQGVLVPQDLTGEAHGFSYDIESKPLGALGGDWVKVHTNAERSLLVLGDVVGKGASAALTHSGIAAAFESQIKLWDRGQVEADELLKEMNTTMFDLFAGEMNTTFAMAEVYQDGRVRVAAGGNFWLHLSPKGSRPLASVGRTMLGVKSEFSILFQDVVMERGDWLVCFTDGVLEGNRPVKRFIRAIQPELADMTASKLKTALKKAGADEVHPDDASMLILRYGSLDSGNEEAA